MQSSAGEFPEDVLFEILIRLRVKSLCRFRSVCTSWLSVISAPYFIRGHYARSKTSPKLLLISHGRRPLSEWHIYESDHQEQVGAGKFPDYWPDWSRPSPSVHGLVCLRGRRGDDFHILNPSTGENISISRPGRISTGENTPNSYHCFGFDPVSDKHKVIYSQHNVIDYNIDGTYAEGSNEVEHWVFTLGSAEKWRRIRVVKGHYYEKCGNEVCVNGVVYFLATDYEPSKHCDCLAAFDLKSESFQIVKLSFPRMGCLYEYKLIEFDGSVGLVDTTDFKTLQVHCRDHRTINVWVLEDFHKPVWSLKRSISAPDSWLGTTTKWRSLYLACALRGAERLVFRGPCHEVGRSLDLFFCDTKNNQFWRTGTLLQGSTGVMCYDHVESLLPLGSRSKVGAQGPAGKGRKGKASSTS